MSVRKGSSESENWWKIQESPSWSLLFAEFVLSSNTVGLRRLSVTAMNFAYVHVRVSPLLLFYFLHNDDWN